MLGGRLLARCSWTLLAASVLCAGPALAQDRAAAEAAAKEVGATAQAMGKAVVMDAGSPESIVPGYAGTDLPQTELLDDPDHLSAKGTSAASGDPSYAAVIDPSRPVFDPTTIDMTGAQKVEQDPDAFLGTGLNMNGTTGNCQQVPKSGTGPSTYFETCNTGEQISTETQTCTIAMVPHVTNTEHFFYYGTTADLAAIMTLADDAYLNGKVAEGVCKPTGVTKQVCDAQMDLGAGGDHPSKWLKFCKDRWKGTGTQYSCSAELPQSELGQHFNTATGTVYLKKEGEVTVTVSREESGCADIAAKSTCSPDAAGDVCTQGPETRTISGVPVTQACWAWTRSFQCTVKRSATDCGELNAKPECHFDHDECLSENPDGSCNMVDKVYACTTPDTSTGAGPAYVCNGDLYCINGECTKIEREASTEFKDAMVAVHTLGEVRDDFDPDTLTLFGGEKTGCHKPVFGLVNCCAGKSSGLITTAAGAAAIAYGPAAIAALATPFLTMFLCSSEEKLLDVKDRMGLCHYVGSYCSDSVLGVCTSKRKSYCCYQSKLARILQEQGRVQIGKPWGKAKSPDCKGFSIEEFGRLDLSKMDFTEVYDEFMDAAKVPDEVQASIDVQKKIEEYYKLHAGS